ncbi:hypothetical protein MNBD_GAMMA12-317 [hydrothermal vent metagenome]|uniref:Leucine Rich repeats (2 copies) n=1 Tax=hydrothermal vent metagenome TaxID=652676 RepID=A0A3B0Y376_9ZZZZ
MRKLSINFMLLAFVSVSHLYAQDLSGVVNQNDRLPSAAISSRVVAEWKQAGALVGWLVLSEKGKWHYLKSQPKKVQSLPVFVWRSYTPNVLSTLAKPTVPFAISFGATKLNNRGLVELTRFKQLRALDISHTKITNSGIKQLAALKNLHSLDLGASTITDAGLKHVGRLSNIQRLYFGSTAVSDSGIKALKKLKKLKILYLYNTKVSDRSLKYVAKMRGLQSILLVKTGVTKRGVSKLYRKRPKLRIWFIVSK